MGVWWLYYRSWGEGRTFERCFRKLPGLRFQLTTQVMQTFVPESFFEETGAGGTANEDPEKPYRESWQAKAKKYLDKRSHDDGQDKGPAPKHRKKSFAWMVSLHQSLKNMTGRGLDHFIVDTARTELAPEFWPSLGISADQGTDGIAASFFMLYNAGVNCEMFWDVAHGVWRDQDLAVSRLGFRSLTYLLVACWNLGHSPYDTCSRFYALQESTDEYLTKYAATCPWLAANHETILTEMDLSDDVSYWDLEAFIEYLKQDWENFCVGTGVKMCRFANFVDKGVEYDKRWTWMLTRLLFLGTQERIFTKAKLIHAKTDVLLPNLVEQGGERVSVAQSNEAIRRFRDANKNLVQLGVQLLGDPTVHSISRVLCFFSQPVRRWYGAANADVRSPSEMEEWMYVQMHGGLWKPLQETFAQLREQWLLGKVGIECSFTEEELLSESDEAFQHSQDQLATLCARYCYEMVGARCIRLLYLWQGWTGRQILFNSRDPAVVEQTENAYSEELRAWQAAQRKKSQLLEKGHTQIGFRSHPWEAVGAYIWSS